MYYREGVADQQLAKLEAERARKRALEQDDDDIEETREPHQRKRSASFDSVSTISTRNSSRSPRPMGRGTYRASPSPSPIRHSPSRVSHSSGDDINSRITSGPVGQDRKFSPGRPYCRGTQSPEPRPEPSERFGQGAAVGRRNRRYSSSLSRSRSPVRQRSYRSRSPDLGQSRNAPRQSQRRQERAPERENFSPPRERRERSLSPFSKRLTLTRNMQGGR